MLYLSIKLHAEAPKSINIMKKIILSVLLMSLFLGAQAQNKYSEQINSIKDSYNQEKLTELYTQFTERNKIQKEEVKRYALLNNIPIRFEDDFGVLKELQYITEDGTPIYYTTFNADAAISTRANYLNTGGGLGLDLNGDDLTAHVWDAGLARTTHQEYDGAGGNNRFSIGDGTTSLHYHSAHVTGTIMASGVEAAAKGMAWQANVVGYDWDNDEAEAIAAAANGMLVSNHSYGYGASGIPDDWFGQYGSDARDWDDIMYNAPYYLMMVAAGNDGNDNSSNGAPLDGNSAYDKLSGHATAKNNLVVANGQDASINGDGSLNSVNINSSSSEGPTDDYRIKPDITGNGTALYSTYESSNTAYNSITGTSMASPNVTGTLLILQEHYNNLNANFMRAATLKGLALHTADDAGDNGPDVIYGWGLLNAKVAAETITTDATASGNAIINELSLSQGQSYQITVQSDGVNPLLASISWTDPAHAVIPGTNNNTPALINDLDIRLDNGATFTPWRLTSITTNGTGDNVVDPYERIDINGASGTYTLTVTHKGTLSSGSQNFSLIVTGIIVVAPTPVIEFETTFNTTNEDTNCSFIDIDVSLNIAQAPSANADVTFSINGSSTATSGLDFDLLTPSVTFPTGSTNPQTMTLRVYHDGFVESDETVIIDFTVNANGGDATGDTNANTFTLIINDDDLVPIASQTNTIATYDMEGGAAGWQDLDEDGDGNRWLLVSGLAWTGIEGVFYASETDLTILGNPGSGTANPDNYLISPVQTISASAINVAFTYGIGTYLDADYYSIYWTTDISNASTMNSGILLEQGYTLNHGSEIRTVNTTAIAGQTGYLIVRHHNSNGNTGMLMFDTLTIDVTTGTEVQTVVNNGSTNDSQDLATSGTIYTSDSATEKLILDITNNQADDYGCLDISVSRAGTGAQSYNGSIAPDFVMDKTFDISPTNTIASGDVSITFYFTETEIAGWESATGLNRSVLVGAREDGGSLLETATLAIGSFGTNVTLTGAFTGLSDKFLFGSTGAFVTCFGVSKTWNGANWSPGGAPDATSSVVINGNYDTATDGDLEVCSLTVNNNKTLTINAGNYIRINGNITVDGSLIVEHQGSVVQVDGNALVTNNGVINVELTTPVLQTRDFMVMGSPMTSEVRELPNGVFGTAFLVLSNTPGNFIPHSEVPAGGTNFADDNGDDWNQFASGPINVGEGYIVRPQSGYSDPANITFNMTYSLGTLNNGDITRPVVYNNVPAGINPDGTPNVYANPYASAISGVDFITDNALVNEIYFWEHLTPPSSSIPGYGSINFSMDDISMFNTSMPLPAANDLGTSTTPNGIISTGQGFGIKAFGAGTVTFTNSMRQITGNTTLRNPVQEQGIDRLTLRVFNLEYGIGSYTGIAFNPITSQSIDAGYDSNRLATTISLYSHLLDGTEQLGIQTREAFESGMKIPMGFASQVKADAYYTITITDTEGENLNLATVYLIDNQENTITNLSEGDYEFRSEEGTFNGRFTLQFEPEEILDTSETSIDAIMIYPNPTQGILTIISPQSDITEVRIYDLRGRKITSVSIDNQGTYQIDLSTFESAMYFVKITTEDGSVTKRIIKE